VSSRLSEEHQNGRRELEVAEGQAADAAFEQLRPLLKPEKTKEARLVLTRMVSKSHSGPIPSAEELELLEHVLPGAANRCFEMAEREQAHRHVMGESIVTKEFSLRGRGQWLAIFALVCLLGMVGWLAYLGDTKAAAWLGAATIVGVVSVFVTGKFIEQRDVADDEPPSSTPPNRKAIQSSKKRPQTRR
jgi:uncharacterized membrane protein